MSFKKKAEKLTQDMEERNFEEEILTDSETQDVNFDEQEKEKVNTLEKECAEWKDKYLRSMAEFENYRRRSIQEKSDWIKLATQKLALNVCDLADNFERAMMQIKEEDKENSFVKGILQIEQQLRSILEKEGVCKIKALGNEFDPSEHEALAHIPSEFEENTVAAVIQNGYTMHGKILRPVRVAVSSGKVNNDQIEKNSVSEDESEDKENRDSKRIEIDVQ